MKAGTGTRAHGGGTAERGGATPDFRRYPLFQAVRLIERLHPHKKPLGQAVGPQEEAVRFSVRTGLAFPASDISRVEQDESGQAVRVEVTPVGLIGPAGVMPHWYHEMALERAQAGDRAMTAFYDMLHHRFISLFYLAWKRSRVAVAAEGGCDGFARYLESLIGMGTAGSAGQEGVRQRIPLFLTGQLARRMPTASTLETVLRHAFRVQVEVEQFVPQVIELEEEDRTSLGRNNSVLGESCVCGCEVWDIQGKFRVRLGPLSFSEFRTFLPGTENLEPLVMLIRYLAGVEYAVEIRLVLRREDVPPCRLGDSGPHAPQLGWTTWLQGEHEGIAADPYLTIQDAEVRLTAH